MEATSHKPTNQVTCMRNAGQISNSLVRESESEVAQLCPTLCDPADCSPPGSSVHGFLQARILEWVAISFSRGSSQPRDWKPGLPHCRQILYLLSHQGKLMLLDVFIFLSHFFSVEPEKYSEKIFSFKNKLERPQLACQKPLTS